MSREITRSYRDPLDLIWIATAERIGFRIERSSEVFASTDGQSVIVVGSGETLDPDDCLAQMILHELCHALTQGQEGEGRSDWGLCNRTDRDVWLEHACLRLQCALAVGHRLREFLAPTTDHRAFYDRLPTDPLRGEDAAAVRARDAWSRATAPPFAPHLSEALAATAEIVSITRRAGRPVAPSLFQADAGAVEPPGAGATA